MTHSSECSGMVVAVQANFYQVRLHPVDDANQPQYLLCTRRTRLKKIGQKVIVGDWVTIEEPDFQGGRGAISEVLPRKTRLDRPLIANADHILLVFAVAEPDLDAWQLSRFLVKAESTSLSVSLCFNKTDLISENQQKQWQERLSNWGYDSIFVSIKHQRNLEKLTEQLTGKTSILAGPSGVGKSSLINYFIPAGSQRTNQVSGKLQKGRHTTRHVELFDLPDGGLLADSPGFNQPDLKTHPQELELYFPEIRHRLAQGSCQFKDCLHRHEPHCVVRGEWERYDHYLKFLEETLAYQSALQQRPDQESSLKLKTKGSGQQEYEPKLSSKKYRRQSRRSKHQKLQDFYENNLEED